jgi:pyrophosphate--fructose-6-phosphate 1-phosphotransferase
VVKVFPADSGDGNGDGGGAAGGETKGAEAMDVAGSGGAQKIGVVFCGRQSPGGHNVIAGLYDTLSRNSPEGSSVLGFVGGTLGLFAKEYVELSAALVDRHRNQGGFDMLGRSVDKIRTPEEQRAAQEACTALGLTGLVMIGGTFTAGDAANLAETFKVAGVATAVVCVPCTIDGDVDSPMVEATLGFDTASKVNGQMIGNVASDINSAKKYYHFVRVMGRKPSHLVLECALQTRPNMVLISEEIAAQKKSLTLIVRELADVICARAADGKNFGLVVIPEGLFDFIPELKSMGEEIGILVVGAGKGGKVSVDDALAQMTPWAGALFKHLPPFIQAQLLLERDSSGEVPLSQIETERLLAELVKEELAARKAAGSYAGKFNFLTHFFGYQARCSFPSHFDCHLGHQLGRCAAALVAAGCSGYMATVQNLREPVEAWQMHGVPLATMLSVERAAGGQLLAVMEPSLVDIRGKPFRHYLSQREAWKLQDL